MFYTSPEITKFQLIFNNFSLDYHPIQQISCNNISTYLMKSCNQIKKITLLPINFIIITNYRHIPFKLSIKNMRTSFVERLNKNTKAQTVPTRESQQKVKERKNKTQKSTFNVFIQHHADLKSMLRFLQSDKNNETFTNQKLLSSGLKTNNKPNKIKDQEDRKQNIIKFVSVDKKTKKQDNLKLLKSQKMIKHDEQNEQINQMRNSTNYQRNTSSFNMIKNLNLIQQKKPRNISRTSQQKPRQQQILRTKQKNTKRGIQNIGNTCYINSIIQCLFQLPCFNDYFYKELYLKDLKNDNSQNNKNVIQKYRELYLYIMKGIQLGEKTTYSLKFSVSKICSLFLDWQQEDAHQFLRQLLDSMHQQINRVKQQYAYRVLKTKVKSNFSNVSSLADEYWEYYKKRDDSYIYDSLAGQIYNNIKCVNCERQSNSFDNCLDLSLPIVKGKDTLEELLEDFFGQEKLTDFYSCQFCGKSNKKSTKTTKFWRTPEYLIIHLKRSQFGRKNTDLIKFPIDHMSVKRYMSDQNQKISNKHSNYTLKGVVCHRGVLQAGHYWSVVRQFGDWYNMDDSHKVKNQFQVKGSSQAYILFYSSMNK